MKVLDHITSLRNLADSIQLCDKQDPILDQEVPDAVYVLAAYFTGHIEDTPIFHEVENIKSQFSQAEALEHIVKPCLQEDIREAGRKAFIQGHPFPAWRQPSWMDRRYLMCPTLKSLRQVFK